MTIDKKTEVVTVVQSAGDNGTVILERKVTEEIVSIDPPPTGMYL